MHFTIPGSYIQEISEHQASLSLTLASTACLEVTMPFKAQPTG